MAVVLVATIAVMVPADGEAGDVGYEGHLHGKAGALTASKPESKLWWNDGYWWASMLEPSSSAYHIYRLDPGTQTWGDTGVPLDTRAGSRADVLWDGVHLYVASHVYTTTPSAGAPSRLYRLSYDGATDTYAHDSQFPVHINDFATETLVIDKDSTGTLWATWVQQNKVWVTHTLGDDRVWATPFTPAVAGTSVDADDISSVVAFGGNRVGLMWSNQTDSAVYFAVHADGDPAQAWEASRTAVQGPNEADDHVNLKAVQADGSGRVFAAVKTNHTASSAPLILLLVRDAVTGDWSSHVFGRVADSHTRPILVLDDEHRRIHVFATGPQPPSTSGQSGGAIYEKTSPMDAISFPSGYGKAVILDADAADINNVTSTKQSVNSTTGLVVAAANETTRRYWHHFDPLAVPSPDFTASPTAGAEPLLVRFTDTSTGQPTSWAWDFGDGATSSAQHPSHTYAAPGTYSVTLTASNATGSATTTKTDFISVLVGPLTADFSSSASAGSAPLAVQFTDTSTGQPTSWAWDFGDGATSSAQHPSHTYAAPGTYSVTLTASNAIGSATTTRTDFVQVYERLSVVPDADAHVNSSKPKVNYGKASVLRVRLASTNSYESYLRFPVSGIGTRSVVSARLRLHVKNASSRTQRVFAVGAPWSELSINWANRPPATGDSLADVGPTSAGGWVDVDLGGAVTGDGAYSFVISGGNSDGVDFASREDVAVRPQLVLELAP